MESIPLFFYSQSILLSVILIFHSYSCVLLMHSSICLLFFLHSLHSFPCSMNYLFHYSFFFCKSILAFFFTRAFLGIFLASIFVPTSFFFAFKFLSVLSFTDIYSFLFFFFTLLSYIIPASFSIRNALYLFVVYFTY